VAYGGKDEAAPQAALMSGSRRAVSARDAGPVSLVNAQVARRGQASSSRGKTGAPEPGFETSIALKVDTARGRVRVAGALVGNSHGPRRAHR